MAVYLTGDIHGDIDIGKLCRYNFDDAGMARDDFVIVLGDFGLPWDMPESRVDKRWLDWLELRPWTCLFIDGNHENFDALETYPIIEDWHGGSVHRLRENVFHLRRGEVYEIGGHTFFTMGGAYSVDKNFRTPGLEWWPQEVPSAEERALAEAKVAEVGKVDYVLSHCPPTRELYNLALDMDPDLDRYSVAYTVNPDEYNDWLQDTIADRLEFKQWFYGHMHIDRWFRRPYTPLYDVIYDLDCTGRTPFGPNQDEWDFRDAEWRD